MAEILDCVEVAPTAPQTGSVIWLHGLGASGHDFEPIVPQLELPSARFVFPHAPEIPVTINAGMIMPAWYDILTLDEVPEREDGDQIRTSAKLIEALIEREIDRGITPDRIVLAGFSQGGAMALHVAARFRAPLCGLMVLSGYLVLGEDFSTEAVPDNLDRPVLFCHGRRDPMVRCGRGRQTYETVAALAPQGEEQMAWHDFSMGHEVCPEEIDVVGTWLRERLG